MVKPGIDGSMVGEEISGCEWPDTRHSQDITMRWSHQQCLIRCRTIDHLPGLDFLPSYTDDDFSSAYSGRIVAWNEKVSTNWPDIFNFIKSSLIVNFVFYFYILHLNMNLSEWDPDWDLFEQQCKRRAPRRLGNRVGMQPAINNESIHSNEKKEGTELLGTGSDH